MESLEELKVVKEDSVWVRTVRDEEVWVTITFTPTVPHCSLATLIGIYIPVYTAPIADILVLCSRPNLYGENMGT